MSFCLQVPAELKDDLILIADKIEPYLQQVKDQADKIPEKAQELAAKIQPAAEQLGDKIEQGASKVTLCMLLYDYFPFPVSDCYIMLHSFSLKLMQHLHIASVSLCGWTPGGHH